MILLIIFLIKFFLLDFYGIHYNTSLIEFLLFCTSTLSFTASGYIFNDLYDVKADRINKPNTYLVSNTISVKKPEI